MRRPLTQPASTTLQGRVGFGSRPLGPGLPLGSTVGLAVGSCTVVGVGASLASVTGTATGSCTVSGVGDSTSGGVAPTNTVAPVASGTVTIGGTLSVTDGTWTGTPAPTLTYQWRRGGVNIGSATANSYTPVAADIGPAIDCVVTGTNASGSDAADSNDLSYDYMTGLGSHMGIYDAAQEITLSGSDVDVWGDRSANGNDLTITTGTRPLYTASNVAFNNQPTATFDGATEWIVDTNTATGGAPSAITFLAVLEVDAVVNNDEIFSYENIVRLMMGTGGVPRIRTFQAGGAILSGTTNMSTVPVCVHAVAVFGASGSQRIGTGGVDEAGPTAITQAAPAANLDVAIGAGHAGTATSAVTVAFAAMLREDISAGDLADFNAYSQWRWSTP